MIAFDTSLVVAALASWHEAHDLAAALLADGPRLPAHVYVESYSVLTRLPPPHRVEPALVDRLLGESFPERPLGLPAAAQRALVTFAARERIAGGAIYDLLVAAAVKHAQAKLLTLDRRAIAAYERVGVDFELVR